VELYFSLIIKTPNSPKNIITTKSNSTNKVMINFILACNLLEFQRMGRHVIYRLYAYKQTLNLTKFKIGGL